MSFSIAFSTFCERTYVTEYSETITNMNFASLDGRWVAIHVRPRREECAALLLREKGYEEFLPLYQLNASHSRTRAQIVRPIFPGYLFCRFNSRIKAPILTTPGVIRILGADKNPTPVSEGEVDAVRAIVLSGSVCEPVPLLQVGDSVKIHSGPLRGLVGILTHVGQKNRLAVSVSILQRSIAVELDREWITVPSQLNNGESCRKSVCLSGFSSLPPVV